MTVRALIQAYHNANAAAGREDTLHAKWWNEALGEEALASLTLALLLTQLDRLAAYGRAPSTVSFYFRFFVGSVPGGLRRAISLSIPVRASRYSNHLALRCGYSRSMKKSGCVSRSGRPMISG
jgi:hypothetical protein